jgi:predicted  nucleic acid-binding Zn-ribbon protein
MKRSVMWVHKCFRNRKWVGEYSTLYKEYSILYKENSTLYKEYSTLYKEYSTLYKEHSTLYKEYSTLYKELADEEIKFYQYFRMSKHQFNYLLQNIEKSFEKEEQHFPRSNVTSGETSNLSMISALNVIFT